MSDLKCPCYVCGFPCTDWSATNGYAEGYFLNVCGLHNPDANKEDGFQPHSLEGREIIALKADYDRLAKEAKVVDSPVYPDTPCKTCSRPNDFGNAKITNCWNCGNLL